MSGWRFKTDFAPRYFLAGVAGALLALAFPKFSVAGFAWVAPGLLLFAGAGAGARRTFRIGFAGGLVFYLVTLYWLLHIPLPVLPIFGWFALSCYVALYTAAWTWLCWRFFPAPIPEAKAPWDSSVLGALLSGSWVARLGWGLQCAAFWVALEMVLGRFLSGFPWEFLGVSQYQMLPVIQIASITGVYGVSFLIIWFSVALMLTGVGLMRNPSLRTFWSKEIAAPLLGVAVAVAWGIGVIRKPADDGRALKLALIQPSIPQTLIWDESENARRFARLLKLSQEALEAKPDVMIWPEAAVPAMLRHDRETAEAVTSLARQHHVWAIVGSDDAEYRPGTDNQRIDYFNSAFAISPEGFLTGRYIKRQLVIFGEYMPLAEWIPFLQKISPAGDASFTPGKKPAPFHLEGLGATISVLICFEDTFPHLVRQYVKPDTDFLVNLTNNGWFGESAAQWQHAASAALRAVENRVPLVRCANNGLTCWVDEFGGLHDVRFPGSSDIYQSGFKICRVPLLPAGQARALSFYTRHGDLFGWACVGVAVASLLGARWKGSRGSKNLSREQELLALSSHVESPSEPGASVN